MSTAPALIWLVGGKKADAREQKQLLEQAAELQVVLVPLRERVDEYADLAANPDTGAVLLSASLWKRSDHTYSSADLAAFLRSLRPELPIYLITSEPDDDIDAFDGVLMARELRKRPDVYGPRLLRAAGRYQTALSERQRRLQELLDRELAAVSGDIAPLGAAEIDELAALRADMERAAQFKVAKHTERLELDLLERRNLVEQLEALTERLARQQHDG
jgi:hypothetical protein